MPPEHSAWALIPRHAGQSLRERNAHGAAAPVAPARSQRESTKRTPSAKRATPANTCRNCSSAKKAPPHRCPTRPRSANAIPRPPLDNATASETLGSKADTQPRTAPPGSVSCEVAVAPPPQHRSAGEGTPDALEAKPPPQALRELEGQPGESTTATTHKHPRDSGPPTLAPEPPATKAVPRDSQGHAVLRERREGRQAHDNAQSNSHRTAASGDAQRSTHATQQGQHQVPR